MTIHHKGEGPGGYGFWKNGVIHLLSGQGGGSPCGVARTVEPVVAVTAPVMIEDKRCDRCLLLAEFWRGMAA